MHRRRNRGWRRRETSDVECRFVGAFDRVTWLPAWARLTLVASQAGRASLILTATSRLPKAVTSHRTPKDMGRSALPS